MKKIFTLFAALMMLSSLPAQTADYEIMPIEMNNLVVTPMDGFEMLEASYPDMALSVTLGVYPDGTLHEASNVTHGENELPIVEGTITKTHSEDLNTDVYTGLVVVQFGEGLMGLNLTMYASSATAIEVNIPDAKVRFDDLNGILLVTATWEGYPVLLTVAGYEPTDYKVFEGPQVSELTIGDDMSEDNWLDYAVTNSVTVSNEAGQTFITGEYTSYATGKVYAVNISTEAQEEDDNVIYEAFELTNLIITPMEDFELLEASYEDLELYVVLGVYEDGSLHEESAIELLGAATPILSGNCTKAYSEDLGTDVYTARVVVSFNGGKLGLELTMYGASTELIITEATATVVEATGVLELKAVWEEYPVLLSVAGYEEAEYKEYEAPQVSELTIGDDDNWFDYAVANVVAVAQEDNEIIIEGEYNSAATGTTYNVIAFATMLGTGVEDITVQVTAVKVIKNGQLIINKGNLEYNAIGTKM